LIPFFGMAVKEFLDRNSTSAKFLNFFIEENGPWIKTSCNPMVRGVDYMVDETKLFFASRGNVRTSIILLE
nr:hypothetical protein [Shewanella ferrihydritica]